MGPDLPRRAAPPEPALPFAPLPSLPAGQRDALHQASFRANDRYLIDFVEAYGFCPYARKGRRLGQVFRYFWHADQASARQLVELMRRIAADPAQLVVQVVVPLVEVSGDAWTKFCSDLTEHANHGLDRDDCMATAALHPALAYRSDNPFSLLTLFRRAPDPTIQWVRLDAVRALYAGRDGGTRAVDPADIEAFLAKPPMAPLYDRIAVTNAAMARRLRIEHIEGLLAAQHRDAQQSYHRILCDPAWEEAPHLEKP